MLSGRVLQRLAGGGLVPVAQAVLVDTFPPAKRASAFALYTAVIVTAPAVGPVLGGWITDNYDWRWIFFINVPIGILAFFLCSRVLHDPPAFEAERAAIRTNSRLRVDGIGIALIAIASATLEVALDRGQIDDWFGSTFITWMIAIAVIGWIATVAWELRLKEPIIEFRLLMSRNFAIANVLLFVFGFGVFGSTVLIPQILQSLYGYRAIDAGLVLGPGALVITVFAPIAAQLIQRQIVSPRTLLTISLAIGGATMWYYGTFTLGTDYAHYALARAYQGLGYGFLFVPVNVLAYSQLRPDQNNRASSLTNLFRNWGGSFGIALMTTIAERREQFHQTNLGSALAASSQQLNNRMTELTNYLIGKGFTGPDASAAANGSLSASPQSGQAVGVYGLFPGDRMPDARLCRAALARPAVQAGRKSASGPLKDPDSGLDDGPSVSPRCKSQLRKPFDFKAIPALYPWHSTRESKSKCAVSSCSANSTQAARGTA